MANLPAFIPKIDLWRAVRDLADQLAEQLSGVAPFTASAADLAEMVAGAQTSEWALRCQLIRSGELIDIARWRDVSARCLACERKLDVSEDGLCWVCERAAETHMQGAK